MFNLFKHRLDGLYAKQNLTDCLPFRKHGLVTSKWLAIPEYIGIGGFDTKKVTHPWSW
jgi:hypothetical protein